MSGFFKNIGIFILLGIAAAIYEVTGPHSPKAVYDKMNVLTKEAAQLESNGYLWFEQATASILLDPQQCASNFKTASIVYNTALDKYTLLYSYAGKLSRWEETKAMEPRIREEIQQKITRTEEMLGVTIRNAKTCLQ